MWYGFRTPGNVKRTLRNLNFRENLKNRQLAKFTPIRVSRPANFNFWRVPATWKFILLRGSKPSTQAYFYSEQYFFNLSFRHDYNWFRYNPQTRVFHFDRMAYSFTYFQYLTVITKLMSRFYKPTFLKIRFKGKGYYMYKTVRNTIAPQMGYAHRVYVYASATSVKFLSKTKILIVPTDEEVEIAKQSYDLIK